ncbi:MAG: methyltransferase domain-containing protein [Bacteroidota bacterium]
MAWFKDWFNTPYYHILYGHHNDEEAKLFIRNLADLLHFKNGQTALDLACGKGRHSKTLNAIGLNVTGVDLSTESISYAKGFENNTLHFEVHDMRKVYKESSFDFVFNLFTSFGYFANLEDNVSTLKGVCADLKDGGLFVQDYFNAELVHSAIIPEQTISACDISFTIKKTIKNNQIIKSIHFEDNGNDYDYKEEVTLFKLADFETMYEKAGLSILHIFGDYTLQPFNQAQSKRLILISRKI